MGMTYKWSDAVTLVNKLIKGTPTSTIDATVCDLVSNEMWNYRPWSWSTTTGTVCTPTNGNQDFSPTAGMYRLLRARTVRTDTTPDQFIELTVRKTLPPDLVARSYTNVTAISLEDGVGLIRLEAAVSIPSSVTLTIQGEWQTNPSKITSTNTTIWFPDQYLSVAAEGLLYWYYKLNDDPRMGGKTKNTQGIEVYTGQYGNFRSALDDMAKAEDFPATDLAFPDEPMGIGRSYTGTINIYGAI